MDLSGRLIDKYAIKQQAGQGGMAEVYIAVDTVLERDVAFKIIRTELFPVIELERVLLRFKQEAKALAKLDHCNIIHILDYGEYDGKPYLVMPYITGGTLKGKFNEQLTWRDALKFVLPIIDAVQYAHEHMILHRDIKPSNILIRENGSPIITDFGVAKILTDPDSSISATMTGIGTPNYMAPEQWEGNANFASDQYSIGVLIYQLITGKLPFAAPTPAAVMVKSMRDPLPTASSFVPELPKEIETLLHKMTMKDPVDRYKDLALVKNNIEALISAKGFTPEFDPIKKVRPAPSFVDEDQTMDTPVVIEARKGFNTKISMRRFISTTGDAIESLAFSLDNSVFANGSEDGTIQLWNTENLKNITTLFGHSDPVRSIVFTKKPFELISCSDDKTIMVWDTDNDENVITLFGHKDMVTSLSYCSSSDLLLSGADDGEVILWSTKNYQMLWMKKIHEDSIADVAFSPDGKYFATASDDQKIKIWNTETRDLFKILSVPTEWIGSLIYSPDGNFLVFGGQDRKIYICETNRYTLSSSFKTKDAIMCFSFSPDGHILACATDSGVYTFKNFPSMNDPELLTIHRSEINTVAISNDGLMMITGDVSGEIAIWDIENTVFGNLI